MMPPNFLTEMTKSSQQSDIPKQLDLIEITETFNKELFNAAFKEQHLNTLHGLNDNECRIALEMYIAALEKFYTEYANGC